MVSLHSEWAIGGRALCWQLPQWINPLMDVSNSKWALRELDFVLVFFPVAVMEYSHKSSVRKNGFIPVHSWDAVAVVV